MLDTPPSRSALDFLDAPGRLTSFLEGKALKAFIRPTGFGMRILGRGAAPVLAGLRRVTGVDLLTDLSTFFTLLGDMTEDFSARAAQVEEMLRADTTAFLLITSAQREPIDEGIWFCRTVEAGGLPFAGVIVNRVHHDMLGDAEPDHLDARISTTTTCSLGAMTTTSPACAQSSPTGRCCWSHSSTTMCTTSTVWRASTAICSRRIQSASG